MKLVMAGHNANNNNNNKKCDDSNKDDQDKWIEFWRHTKKRYLLYEEGVEIKS